MPNKRARSERRRHRRRPRGGRYTHPVPPYVRAWARSQAAQLRKALYSAAEETRGAPPEAALVAAQAAGATRAAIRYLEEVAAGVHPFTEATGEKALGLLRGSALAWRRYWAVEAGDGREYVLLVPTCPPEEVPEEARTLGRAMEATFGPPALRRPLTGPEREALAEHAEWLDGKGKSDDAAELRAVLRRVA